MPLSRRQRPVWTTTCQARRRQDLLPAPRASRRVDAPSPDGTGADVDPLPNWHHLYRHEDGSARRRLDRYRRLGSEHPNGKDNWCQLANGYEYNLEITPPGATNENIQIVATGRKICTPAYSTSSSCAPGTSTTQWRAVQEWVHWSLLSDFQMITNSDYSAGSTATTNGKIYAGQTRAATTTTSITRAPPRPISTREGTITGPASLQNGAQKYARHDDSHAAPGADQLQQLHLIPRRPQDGGDHWGRVLRRQLPRLEVRAARERHLHRSGLHANRG